MANIKHVDSVVDRDFRNRINQLIDFVNSIGTSLNDLVVKGVLTTEQYSELLTTINGLVKVGEINLDTLSGELKNELEKINNKVDKGNVSVADINKNLGKFDQTYMTDEFLQQMAGGAAVNATPAWRSIVTDQVAFLKRSKNLFDYRRATLDHHIDSLTGEVVPNSQGLCASDYILIESGMTYITNGGGRYGYAWYDGNRKHVGGGVGSLKEAPENAKFIRFTFPKGYLERQQLEKGSSVTEFEPFYEILPIELQEKREITGEDLPVIPTEKLEIVEPSSNLFDKRTVTENRYVSNSSGFLIEANNFIASDYIRVQPNETYIIRRLRQYAFYDDKRVYLSGKADSTSKLNEIITAPENAHFIRFSWYLPTNGTSIHEQQMNEGNTLLPYEEFGGKIKDELIPSNINSIIKEKPEIYLPSKLYAVVGKELNIYFDNIIKGNASDYNFDVTCSVGAQFENFFRVTPTNAGTFPITIQVYKDNTEVVLATSEIIVSNTNAGEGVERNFIVIGDSTTAGSAPMKKFHENFDGDVMNVNTLGTRGDAPFNHEGRSGWTARQYVTVAEDHIVPDLKNAFWNPNTTKFDFSYYMSSNGYSSVDYVVLNLGINDTFIYTDDDSLQERIDEFLSQYNEMISSIHSYDSTIKIGVALTIPPHYSQDAFARSYRNGQTRWRYKRNNFFLVKALIETFDGRESSNIYLVPINTNLDTKYNFPIDYDTPQVPVNARNPEITVTNPAANAGVHPTTSGYWQTADVYWYWLKSFEN